MTPIEKETLTQVIVDQAKNISKLTQEILDLRLYISDLVYTDDDSEIDDGEPIDDEPVMECSLPTCPTGAGTFPDALKWLAAGRRATRKGWNGKGMFVWLMRGSMVAYDASFTDPVLIDIAKKNNGIVRFNDSFRLYCADGSVTTGWRPTQTDMTAGDWVILP